MAGSIIFDGLTVIRHSTITGNTAPDWTGGGIASFGDTAFTRTEVAFDASSPAIPIATWTRLRRRNTFQSNGYNLIGTGNATGEFVEPGDQTGVTDPMLGPLADNGGPTMTHALSGRQPGDRCGRSSGRGRRGRRAGV